MPSSTTRFREADKIRGLAALCSLFLIDIDERVASSLLSRCGSIEEIIASFPDPTDRVLLRSRVPPYAYPSAISLLGAICTIDSSKDGDARTVVTLAQIRKLAEQECVGWGWSDYADLRLSIRIQMLYIRTHILPEHKSALAKREQEFRSEATRAVTSSSGADTYKSIQRRDDVCDTF